MTFALVLGFDTEDPEFARGFEAGRLYELLRLYDHHREGLDGQPFHASNVEMVLRMVERFGVDLRAQFTDDDAWMVLTDD